MISARHWVGLRTIRRRVDFMGSDFRIGETVYLVEHTPFAPTGPDNVDNPFIEQAYKHTRTDVLSNLPRAIAFARRAVKADFFGEVTIREATIVPNARNELEAEELDGGYALKVYR
jgi:hypothetical protein